MEVETTMRMGLWRRIVLTRGCEGWRPLEVERAGRGQAHIEGRPCVWYCPKFIHHTGRHRRGRPFYLDTRSSSQA